MQSRGYTRRVSLFRSASVVSLFTLLSRVTGLIREWLIAVLFGASALTDAFNVAFRIPNLFRRLFAEGAFSQAFVPELSRTRATQGDEATRSLLDAVASLLSLILVGVSVLGVVGAPLLVWALASGLSRDPQTEAIAVTMTRWMFPYIACMSLVALCAGVLNTHRRFAVPAVTPVLLNLCLIGSAMVLTPWMNQQGWPGIYALALGVMAGGVLQLAVQWPALRAIGMVPRISWRLAALRQAWRNPGTQHILTRMGPALLGVGVAQLSLLINTQIASYLSPGSVSWLSYADRLMEFPTALLGVALGVTLTPSLASARASGNAQEFSSMLDWGMRAVLALAWPCGVALMVFAEPLVSVLYHYGQFAARDVAQTALALRGYGLGLLGLIAVKVLAPAYFAEGDTRTPVRIAVRVLLITQLFNLALVPYLAHGALSLSIGLGACANALWLIQGLRRSGRWHSTTSWRWDVLRVMLASAVMAAGLWWSSQHWHWVDLGQQPLLRAGLMAAVLSVAALIYLTLLALMKFPLRSIIKA
ncbi:MAG: putative peptidoglycan biosynthesis protein MurJ [Pseudomonadota bacterium]|jgi:putative peptidoglycan lipid II flippase